MNRSELFAMRLSPEERAALVRMRGHLETQEGVRLSLADVLRRALKAYVEDIPPATAARKTRTA